MRKREPAVVSAEAQTEVFAFAGFSLDPRQRLLFGPDGKTVPLSARAFDTLLYLVEHPNQLIDKHAMIKALWPNVIVEENNLNQNISIVRRALGETAGEHRFVVTVPGRGFRFVPSVTRRDAIPKPGPPPTESPDPTSSSESTQPSELPAPAGALGSPRPSAAPAQLLSATHSKPRSKTSGRWIGIALGAAALVLTGYFLVHHFQGTSATVPAAPSRADATVDTPGPSIAVLPFVNMSADKDQEYFSDGLTEELSAQLGQVQGLRVAGRTSAFAFKGKNEDLRLIGTALGVDHLLEGSVRKAGNELRITAQLIDAKNGSHVWSNVYERKLDEIFAVQEEIAKAVAAELSTTLRTGSDELSLPGTHNTAAYDAYLAARADLKQWPAMARSVRAIQELEHAVALDPKFLRAWADLAYIYESSAGSLPVSDADYLRKAQVALSRALELAPDSPNLRVQAAIKTIRADHDWMALDQIYRKWVDGPGSPDFNANMLIGAGLRGVGRPHESLRYHKRAVRTEPLVLNGSVQLQDTYLIIGDWKAAEAEYERSKHLGGDTLFADAEGLLAAGLDRHDPALVRRFYQAHRREFPYPGFEGMDNPDGALALLQSRYRDPASEASSLNLIVNARFAAYYGDPQLALQFLRKAYKPSQINLFFIWHPVFKDTRRLPGFKDLARELRLVDYWRATGDWGEFCHPVGADDFECS